MAYSLPDNGTAIPAVGFVASCEPFPHLKSEIQLRAVYSECRFDRANSPARKPSHCEGLWADDTELVRTRENIVTMAPSNNGFLLLDAGLNLIASNGPALQILCFPSGADRIKQPKVFLADRVRTALIDHRNPSNPVFVREYKSGKRRYICKNFQVDCNGQPLPFSPLSLCFWSGMLPAALRRSQKSPSSSISRKESVKQWSFYCKA